MIFSSIQTRNLVVPFLAFFAFVTAGCSLTNEITNTKNEIEQNTRINAHTGIVLSLGPGLFQTTGFVTKFIDERDAQLASRLAYGIRRVKAGVYPLKRRSNINQLDLPSLKRFQRRGWQPAIKVEADHEIGWIMYRQRGNRVKDMFVVVVTEEEMVLARIQGNLTELLDVALDEIESEGESDFFNDWSDWDF
ncbi:MAG: DUF4252 domain-containing protein [Bacteroidota bacterium]